MKWSLWIPYESLQCAINMQSQFSLLILCATFSLMVSFSVKIFLEYQSYYMLDRDALFVEC